MAELAEYPGVTPAWVYNNHRPLNILARKLDGHLRFRLADVDRWVDRECPAVA